MSHPFNAIMKTRLIFWLVSWIISAIQPYKHLSEKCNPQKMHSRKSSGFLRIIFLLFLKRRLWLRSFLMRRFFTTTHCILKGLSKSMKHKHNLNQFILRSSTFLQSELCIKTMLFTESIAITNCQKP